MLLLTLNREKGTLDLWLMDDQIPAQVNKRNNTETVRDVFKLQGV